MQNRNGSKGRNVRRRRHHLLSMPQMQKRRIPLSILRQPVQTNLPINKSAFRSGFRFQDRVAFFYEPMVELPCGIEAGGAAFLAGLLVCGASFFLES